VCEDPHEIRSVDEQSRGIGDRHGSCGSTATEFGEGVGSHDATRAEQRRCDFPAAGRDTMERDAPAQDEEHGRCIVVLIEDDG